MDGVKATTLDKNIPVPGIEKELRGAALLAGLGAGVYKDFEEAFQKLSVREVFEPQKSGKKA